MDISPSHILDSAFIENLFQHPTFQVKLQKALKESRSSDNHPNKCTEDELLTGIVQEISEIINKNQQKGLCQVTRQLKKQISEVYAELEKLRDSFTFQCSKIECPTKQIEEDCNLEDEHFLDFSSIKRSINYLQEKVKELNLNSSALLDSTICSKDQKNKEELIFQEKITSTISQMEQSMIYQRENFEKSINKQIEKQQKTINNILETLNDIHGPALSEKTENILTNSKSATKLKNFFGFR